MGPGVNVVLLGICLLFDDVLLLLWMLLKCNASRRCYLRVVHRYEIQYVLRI